MQQRGGSPWRAYAYGTPPPEASTASRAVGRRAKCCARRSSSYEWTPGGRVACAALRLLSPRYAVHARCSSYGRVQTRTHRGRYDQDTAVGRRASAVHGSEPSGCEGPVRVRATRAAIAKPNLGGLGLCGARSSPVALELGARRGGWLLVRACSAGRLPGGHQAS